MDIDTTIIDEAIKDEMVVDTALIEKEVARRKRIFVEYMTSPDYMKKLTQRLQINDACYRYPEARKEMYRAMSNVSSLDEMVESCIVFLENFGFTFDPRPEHNPHHLPFIMFNYQKKAIRWMIEHIEGSRDGLIEKSRDMGVTWTVFVWVPIWYWLFKDGVNMLVGSYKESLVDNGSKDSIFGMMDYAIQSLPKWLLPRGWNKDKNRTHLKLINPMNWNQIMGDTMNREFGRGTRKTCILFDELGHWEYSKDAWEAAADSASCRIANSTPMGYNYYAMLAESDIDKLRLHWMEHPLKDQEWYKFECARRTPEEVAQELDISYNKSQTGRVYPEWSETNVEKGDFQYNPSWPLYIFWDFGKTDDTAMIWAQKNRENGKLRIVDTYTNTGKLISFYVPFVDGIVRDSSYLYSPVELNIINQHKLFNKATHFGDPAGRFGNQVVNSTVVSILRDSGIYVNFRDDWKGFMKRKTAARGLINRGIELNDNQRTKYFNLCMLSASYPRTRSNGLEEIKSADPKHDFSSHYRSAFEYGALGLESYKSGLAKVYDKKIISRGNRISSY